MAHGGVLCQTLWDSNLRSCLSSENIHRNQSSSRRGIQSTLHSTIFRAASLMESSFRRKNRRRRRHMQIWPMYISIFWMKVNPATLTLPSPNTNLLSDTPETNSQIFGEGPREHVTHPNKIWFMFVQTVLNSKRIPKSTHHPENDIPKFLLVDNVVPVSTPIFNALEPQQCQSVKIKSPYTKTNYIIVRRSDQNGSPNSIGNLINLESDSDQ